MEITSQALRALSGSTPGKAMTSSQGEQARAVSTTTAILDYISESIRWASSESPRLTNVHLKNPDGMNESAVIYTMGLNDTNVTDENITDIFVPMDTLVSLNYNLPTMILVASVLFVVIVATAFGNLLVGLALFKFRYLRTVSNYLIGNLAISDFLLATTILPLSTVNECLGHWVFGQVMCNFWLMTDVLYCTASIWNLCIIAFDRFTATLYPLWYREKRSTKQAAIYVALVWLISTAISVPPLLGWNDLTQNYVFDNNTNLYHCNLFQTPSYVLYSALGSFFIPFIITFFLYVRIFSVLRERMSKMRNASKMSRMQTHANAQKEKPLLNNAGKQDHSIEMTTAPGTNEGSGNTEEMSSKSLFGSDSGGEEDEEEESSSLGKSDNPLCQTSCSEADQPNQSLIKNGLKHFKNKGQLKDTMVIHNPHHHTSESERDSEAEGKKAAATEDESNRDSDADAKRTLCKPPATVIQNKDTKDSDTDGGKQGSKKSGGLSNPFRSVNPFKQQKKKVRTSVKHRYEQREMRATIRMAIIIAFFSGMWLGFFVVYVVRAWCTNCPIPRELDAFFFWLGYSNSSVNPILYTIFNEEFRRAFQKILGCYKKKGRGNTARR